MPLVSVKMTQELQRKLLFASVSFGNVYVKRKMTLNDNLNSVDKNRGQKSGLTGFPKRNVDYKTLRITFIVHFVWHPHFTVYRIHFIEKDSSLIHFDQRCNLAN